MELLIAAGVAALGYSMSGRRPPAQPATPTQQQQQQEQPSLSELRRSEEQRVAARATAEAQDPMRSGVILQQRLQPFFRSSRTQNSNDNVKSRLHDLFTGSVLYDTSETGTYKKKQESGPRFQPMPQPVTSSGSSGNPACLNRQLPVPSMLQNNVLPTEQIRVGPGLGVGMDVAASDGFHPMLRVMPQNVGEYKLNQLESRINHGSAVAEMRPADPNVAVNRPPKVWDINRRPPEPTKAAVNARTSRYDGMGMKCVDDRYEGDEYYGHPAQPAHHVPGESIEQTRLRGDQHPGLPQTNVTGARHGIGGFATATFDTQRIDSQSREHPGFEGMVTGDHRRAMAPTGHVLPPTHRDMAHSAYIGGAGHMVPSNSTRPFDSSRTTLRETTAGPNDNGPAAPVTKAPMIRCTYQHLEKEAKRPHTVGFFPLPERNTEFRRANVGSEDPWELAGICKGKYVALRDRETVNRQMSHAASQSMYGNVAPPGQQTTPVNKLPEHNPRQDFGLAQTVLKDNVYHVSIS